MRWLDNLPLDGGLLPRTAIGTCLGGTLTCKGMIGWLGPGRATERGWRTGRLLAIGCNHKIGGRVERSVKLEESVRLLTKFPRQFCFFALGTSQLKPPCF